MDYGTYKPKIIKPKIPSYGISKKTTTLAMSYGTSSGSSGEKRLLCPNCNSHSIRVVDDKNKPISYINGITIYQKKHICKKCSHIWT